MQYLTCQECKLASNTRDLSLLELLLTLSLSFSLPKYLNLYYNGLPQHCVFIFFFLL